MKALKFDAIPKVLIIDPQGRIAALGDPREVKLADVIDRLLSTAAPRR